MRQTLATGLLAASFGLAAALGLVACDEGGDGTTAPPKKVPYEWTLNLDMAGDASCRGLKKDTTVGDDFDFRGLFTGKVNAYDTSLALDTLYFLNWEYSDFHVSAPLSAEGNFSFDDFDLLGDLDGSMTLMIWLKGKKADRPPSPDTLRLELGRILEFERP